MNFQTSPMLSQFSQPTLAYNPQALNHLRLLMLSQSYQNRLNFQKNIMAQKSGILRPNPISFLTQQKSFSPPKMVLSPSIFDLSSCATSREASLKTNSSPVSHSMFSLSEERRDCSESSESFEVPILSETESLIKEEIPKDEADRGLMKQSKKIHKQSPSSQSQKKLEAKQNNNIKRQKWHEEEDTQLLALFGQHGPKWTVIASLMKERTAKQIRDRYKNILRPDIKRDLWTSEEEKLFDALYAQYGNRWCKIAEHLPGRSENQVKNKFYLQKKRDEGQKVQTCSKNVESTEKGASETKMEYEGGCFGTENISLKKEEA